MRIKELNLIKYGKFEDRSLSFPGAASDFHVIVGPNEAGKSTIRNAISDLFFGMKNLTPYGFLHGVNELRLGGLLEQEGAVASFHRARGRSGTLRTPEDVKLPDDFLAPHLGAATREFFEQMFGLDHERLVQGGQSILDASDKLGQVLFESAAGIGVLGPLRQAFETRASEIWAPRRTSTEFAQADTAFAQAVAELKAAQVRTNDWRLRKEALDGISEQLEEVRKKMRDLEAQRSKLERIRRLAPFLRALEEAKSKLTSLGDVVIDMPDGALDLLLSAQREIATANATLNARIEEVDARTREHEGLTVDEEVLELASNIEKLDRLRGSCVNHPRDLPLRRAEYARFIETALQAAAQLGWHSEEQVLREALPKTLITKTLTSLLRQHGGLDQALRNANDAHQDAQKQLSELGEQLAAVPAASASVELRHAFSAAMAFKNFAATRATLQSTVASHRRKADVALNAIAAWQMSIDQLRKMSLPSVQRLALMQQQASEHRSAVKAARNALENARADVERLTLQETHFTENNRVVTANEVREARAQRDAAWANVKTGAVKLQTGAHTVDQAIRLADELVDTQLGTVQSTAALQQLRQEVETAQTTSLRRQGELQQSETAIQDFDKEWLSIVTAAGLPGLALDDAQAWLSNREIVVNVHDLLAEKEAELATLDDSASVARMNLQAALGDAVHAPHNDSLVVLIDVAQSQMDEAQRSDAVRTSLQDREREAQQAIRSAEAKLTSARDSMGEWTRQWEESLRAANLERVSPSVAAAEAALALVETVASNLAAADDPGRRIQAMQDDLRNLQEDARAIALKLGAETVSEEGAFHLAEGLVARLNAARQAKSSTERLSDQLRQARDKVEEARTTVSAALARIKSLLERAGVSTLDECIPIAEVAAKRKGFSDEREKARAELVRSGDGLSVDALAVEIRSQDPDQVSGLLEQTKHQLSEEGERHSQLLQRQAKAQQEFDLVKGQASAAVAEAKRQEALATLGDAAEQYVELAVAQRLLKWAIDRYREQQQGPMLKRASEIFAGLTLGDFSRLVVDAEANPPRLEAKRSSGHPVQVCGLSEGTRDQLFLALRIAALELQVASRTAMPFIADDLFINFDDERARAGFEALKELSTKTQVLFLTHHQHLVPIIRNVCGEAVNVVELERIAVAA